MANIKPIDLKQGHVSHKEIENRKKIESNLKSKSKIKTTPPKELDKMGKKIYRDLLKAFPEGFICATDVFTLGIVADSLSRMKACQLDINECGLINLGDGKPNPSVAVYDKYSKIYEKFSSKLGLSPKDRASLAVLLMNQETEKEDELLNILKS